MLDLFKRQYYGDECEGGYGYYGNCNSNWSTWGRWVALAVIIFGAFFIFFLFACITARRRRRLGYNPYRGTGWAVGQGPWNHGPATYYGNNQQAYPQQEQNTNNAAGPPPYGASNDYYGGRNDVELQQPQQAYGGSYGQSPEAYAAPPAKGRR